MLFALLTALICVALSRPDRLGLVRAYVQDAGLDSWIQSERTIARQRIGRNIGPILGAGEGLIVASPSWGQYQDEPDYYYTWTRDAALTISTLLADFLPTPYLTPWNFAPQKYNMSEGDVRLEPLLREYVNGQASLQVVQNPSGNLFTGGLSEPKFHVDGTAFTGAWGRPQRRDGPALRALALIPYAHYLLDRAWPTDITYVLKHLWDPHSLREQGSVIKNDLEEVGGSWSKSGFDLWEELNGYHLFTLLVSYRALQAGSILARRLNDTGAADYYISQSKTLATYLPDFLTPEYWTANLPSNHIFTNKSTTGTPAKSPEKRSLEVKSRGYFPLRRDRTGLDCAFLLSLIHAGGDILPVSAPESLETVWKYVKSFEGIYQINQGSWTNGWAVGRYAEDVYNGVGIGQGNPWFICTFSTAQVLYSAQSDFHSQGSIQVSNTTVDVWADILGVPSATLNHTAIWKAGSSDGMFDRATKALIAVGDAYMDVGKKYAVGGRMKEEIDRHDGHEVGARDLTWSYASFLSAARARDLARSIITNPSKR
ncbi:hypothetical protein TREMEDRAFT_37964 [Tremella mesenterica DSM 1558]|uniref:uncharacterized protein n=1 Tax=Tremella mesenterica (strain ATCC 24925 / CBS 8224 / DSM 1558 / NBRC 9311 / NRRL Y-6157 / RJB 2259-6 / UBC 559-6) TaxID=578456 RepID=UPI0003F49367|nr:uncharacterized protein TREMEDRAFT_37964 [Tremella mesenterica DSM 1558]EIW71627.1 hypothetical protein TREMEDRAFT_37964 [Tremella mesenterica DSM 1558]